MTSLQQRAELHRQIWQIANDVRGSVDDGILSNTFWARFSTVLSAKIFPAILKPVMTVSVMRNWMTA